MSAETDKSATITFIKPSGSWLSLDLKDLLTYRELLYFLTWRDVKVRYKQTAIGVLWAILQPVLTTVLFTVIFSTVARFESQNVPYPLFALSGFMIWLFVSYGKIARPRHPYSPETLTALNEFLTRRTELDRQAMLHRLGQVAEFDPRDIARSTRLPVYYLSAKYDLAVPFFMVRPWLRNNCPSLHDVKSIPTFDHNILATSHAECASQILAWMQR